MVGRPFFTSKRTPGSAAKEAKPPRLPLHSFRSCDSMERNGKPFLTEGEAGVQISQFFINGDLKGAIAYMREHGEFKDILPGYVAIFENCEYRTYEIPDILNDILRLYQIYFRDTFYCGLPEPEAADKLRTQLKVLLNLPEAEEALLTEKLQSMFEEKGFRENPGVLRSVCLEGNRSDGLSRRASGGDGGIHGQYSQRLHIPKLDGLSDLWQALYQRLGFARRHDQLY